MAEDTFKLPGSSYEELSKIIKAYASSSKDTSPAAVGQLAGVDQTQVSRNNGFLVSAGLVEGKQKKTVSELGESLGRALDLGVEEEVRRTWARIVRDTEFLQRIISAVRIRKGMEPNALRSHIAYTAGQKKSGTVMAGAGALIEILKVAGALKEEDGKLNVAEMDAGAPDSTSGHGGAEDASQGSQQGSLRGSQQTKTPLTVSHDAAGVTINIEVSVQVAADELEGLGGHLRALMDQLAEPPTGKITPDEN
jgi:hypothetical protein